MVDTGPKIVYRSCALSTPKPRDGRAAQVVGNWDYPTIVDSVSFSVSTKLPGFLNGNVASRPLPSAEMLQARYLSRDDVPFSNLAGYTDSVSHGTFICNHLSALAQVTKP